MMAPCWAGLNRASLTSEDPGSQVSFSPVGQEPFHRTRYSSLPRPLACVLHDCRLHRIRSTVNSSSELRSTRSAPHVLLFMEARLDVVVPFFFVGRIEALCVEVGETLAT